MSTLASVTVYDLIANRPSPGIPGRLFFASDTGAAYYDTGSAWEGIATSSASGVIGTAVFSASGGTIADLTVAGVISAVTRLGTGNFEISFGTAQSNYTIAMAATDNNLASMGCYVSGNTFATLQTGATSFNIFTFYYGSTNAPEDPAMCTVTVFQL